MKTLVDIIEKIQKGKAEFQLHKHQIKVAKIKLEINCVSEHLEQYN